MSTGKDADVLEIDGHLVCTVFETPTVEAPPVIECCFTACTVDVTADDARSMADFWAGVAKRAGTEPTEVARLRRLLDQDPTVHDWRPAEGGGVETRIEHWAARSVAASFVDSLGTAENYMQMAFQHDTAGPITVTIQRVGKVTPHGAREAAEAEVRRLRGILSEYRIHVTGPTKFTPDDAADLPGMPNKDHREWLWIDATRSPNVCQCKRCGAEQVLPTPCGTAIQIAVINAFAEAHEKCQEGDDSRLPRRRKGER